MENRACFMRFLAYDEGLAEAQEMCPLERGESKIQQQQTVSGKPILLTAGDEVVYPLICANTDAAAFDCPHEMKVDR